MNGACIFFYSVSSSLAGVRNRVPSRLTSICHTTTHTHAHLLELVELFVLQGQDPALFGVAADLLRGQAGRRRRGSDLFRLRS